MRRTAISAAAVVAATVLAACGQSTHPSATATTTSATSTAAGVTVTPASGGQSTVFSARFIAPASSGTGAKARIGYTVGLTGSAGRGCVAVRSVPVISAHKGHPVLVALDPARLGGRWCPGAHSVRVFELQRPQCAAGIMCPQFVRVIAVIGTARFDVKPH